MSRLRRGSHSSPTRRRHAACPVAALSLHKERFVPRNAAWSVAQKSLPASEPNPAARVFAHEHHRLPTASTDGRVLSGSALRGRDDRDSAQRRRSVRAVRDGDEARRPFASAMSLTTVFCFAAPIPNLLSGRWPALPRTIPRTGRTADETYLRVWLGFLREQQKCSPEVTGLEPSAFPAPPCCSAPVSLEPSEPALAEPPPPPRTSATRSSSCAITAWATRSPCSGPSGPRTRRAGPCTQAPRLQSSPGFPAPLRIACCLSTASPACRHKAQTVTEQLESCAGG